MIAAAHAAFVLTGTVTTLLGPLLPILAARWTLDDRTAGYFFTAQFAGSIVGVALSGTLVGRLGFARAVMTGIAAMAAGVGSLPIAPWPPALLCVAWYGVGLGITIPATNLLVADATPDRRAGALNILNLAWGLGAVAGPPVFAWFAAGHHVDGFLFALSGALGAVVLLLAASARSSTSRPTRSSDRSPKVTVRWTSAAFLVYGALFFLYVGTENAVAGWVAALARRLDPGAIATSTPAAFWAGLLIGRGAAPALLQRLSEAFLVQAGLTVAAAGVILVVTASTVAGVTIATAICGLGLSIVFPTTIAQLSRRFGDASARAAAGAFALAGLGGATIPWLVGFWSTATGSLRAAMIVPLVGCILLMVLHAFRTRRVG